MGAEKGSVDLINTFCSAGDALLSNADPLAWWHMLIKSTAGRPLHPNLLVTKWTLSVCVLVCDSTSLCCSIYLTTVWVMCVCCAHEHAYVPIPVFARGKCVHAPGSDRHSTWSTYQFSSFEYTTYWVMVVIITCCAVSRARAPTGPLFVSLGHWICTHYSRVCYTGDWRDMTAQWKSQLSVTSTRQSPVACEGHHVGNDTGKMCLNIWGYFQQQLGNLSPIVRCLPEHNLLCQEKVKELKERSGDSVSFWRLWEHVMENIPILFFTKHTEVKTVCWHHGDYIWQFVRCQYDHPRTWMLHFILFLWETVDSQCPKALEP